MAQCRADPTTHHSGRTSSGATDLTVRAGTKRFHWGEREDAGIGMLFYQCTVFLRTNFLKNNLDTGLPESTSNPNPACKHFEAKLGLFFFAFTQITGVYTHLVQWATARDPRSIQIRMKNNTMF